MPLPKKSLKLMFLFLGLAAVFGIFLIGYGFYMYSFRHPADYTEAKVTVGAAASSSAAAGAEKPAPEPVPAAGDTLKVEGHTFSVDLADTPAKQSQGLSGRDKLTDAQGMLFVFTIPRKEWFWMYDMKFPLDIVWIRNGIVTGVSANLPAPEPGQASSSLPTFASPGIIDQALEINAGLAAKYGINAGDRVDFIKK
jgi:uncharacterized membrane protein (UPF0127 family)